MFTTTPKAIIETAQHHFMSEDFDRGFNIIRESFGDDVTDDTIFDLLLGRIGFEAQDNEVSFGKEFIDKEYAEELSEVLASYDNILEINGEYYELTNSLEFGLTNFAETSDFIKYINENVNTLIPSALFRFKKQMAEYGVSSFDLCEYVYYTDKNIYFFRDYNKANIGGVTKIKSDVLNVIELYNKRGY